MKSRSLSPRLPGRVVGGEEEAEGVAPALARQLDRDVGVNDGARVDGRELRAEDFDAFEEEGALLLEEDGEALVGRVDRGVGLDLREVGVDGEVERRVGVDAELGRQAGVEADGAVDEAAGVSGDGDALRADQRALPER